MKPICVKCQRFYRAKKTGVYFAEGMPKGSTRPQPGTAEPENWKPYKIWAGDLWHCPDCGHELISGVGFRAVSEQFYDDFTQWSERAGWLVVKDC